jgi:hypothetical protein
VQPAEATIEGRKITLVDTPGFDDTHLTDREVLKLIADWLKYTYDEGTRLSGLLFFHNISSDRMEGSALKNLHMFRQLCGDHNLRNVVLTTTKWSVVNTDVGLRREQELIQNFWADMINKGSRVDRVGNDAHTATNLVKTFFSNPFFVPQLQQELVDGKPLSQTAAGSEVSREIRKIRAEYRKQLADAKAEMEQARTKGKLSVGRKDFNHICCVHELNSKLDQKLYADQISQLNDRIKNLSSEQEQLRNERIATIARCTRKWWQSSWRCLDKCGGSKTQRSGIWKCSSCKREQNNVFY